MTSVSESERRTSYAVALYEALRDQLRLDPQLTVLGNWIFGLNYDHLMDALRNEFRGRIVEPPVAEAAIAALGVGAAMAGAPTFVDLTIGSFALLAMSPIVNEASVIHYLSNGQVAVPVVFHLMHGVVGSGVQHSCSPQAQLWNSPGLQIVMPSTPYDAKGLMTTALRSPNPTVFIDHPKLFTIEGVVPEASYAIPFGTADIKRSGRDVTVVATSNMVQVALGAAESLSKEGIDIEIVDLRTLVPLDEQTLLDSVGRTGRLAVLDESVRRCGVASEIIAVIAESAHKLLRTRPVRITRADVPSPFSSVLGGALMPDQASVVSALREYVRSDG
jgi:pyruvate dehydrogenase E1 component beta subunit